MKEMLGEYGSAAIGVTGALLLFFLFREPLFSAGGALCHMILGWF